MILIFFLNQQTAKKHEKYPREQRAKYSDVSIFIQLNLDQGFGPRCEKTFLASGGLSVQIVWTPNISDTTLVLIWIQTILFLELADDNKSMKNYPACKELR